MIWTSSAGRELRLEIGDITKVAADAIVNAANAELAGGGGVDGAIHRVGGPSIMRELDRIRVKIGGRCAPGGAIATTAGALPAEYVFHAVGPIYQDGLHGEPQTLASCYATCMELADELHVARITFPAISTGVYGYPIRDAAKVALAEVMRRLDGHETTVQVATFVLFGQEAYDAFAEVLKELGG
jgi:O-acetyl-ADP-ribose deacetylase (regulator of RNase III)